MIFNVEIVFLQRSFNIRREIFFSFRMLEMLESLESLSIKWQIKKLRLLRDHCKEETISL